MKKDGTGEAVPSPESGFKASGLSRGVSGETPASRWNWFALVNSLSHWKSMDTPIEIEVETAGEFKPWAIARIYHRNPEEFRARVRAEVEAIVARHLDAGETRALARWRFFPGDKKGEDWEAEFWVYVVNMTDRPRVTGASES